MCTVLPGLLYNNRSGRKSYGMHIYARRKWVTTNGRLASLEIESRYQ